MLLSSSAPQLLIIKKRFFLSFALSFACLPVVAFAVDASNATIAAAIPVAVDTPFNRFVKNKLAVYVDTAHYSWQGNDGTEGQQTVTPLTLTYRMGVVEAGLRTGFISSKNTTIGREGEVSTLGDTNLSTAYSQKFKQGWSVRYNLDWNLPTGKESLGGTQKFAVMDGNLVQQTRFGEGTNITPSVSVAKALNANSLMAIGLSHTWRGAYDPNSDVSNDEIDPGDESALSLQGQYGVQQWLVLGGLTYTKASDTDFGGSPYYRKGNRTDANVTGMLALPKAQQVTLMMRYSQQSPDTYTDRKTGNYQKESSNVNGHSTYVFSEYSKRLDRHTLRANAAFLKIDANSYDQLSDLYNAGRNKRELGVGYNFAIAQQRGVRVDVKRMNLDDKATPATLVDTQYKGWTVSAGVNWAF